MLSVLYINGSLKNFPRELSEEVKRNWLLKSTGEYAETNNIKFCLYFMTHFNLLNQIIIIVFLIQI